MLSKIVLLIVCTIAIISNVMSIVIEKNRKDVKTFNSFIIVVGSIFSILITMTYALIVSIT
jgi:hypothetical protein